MFYVVQEDEEGIGDETNCKTLQIKRIAKQIYNLIIF